jgi:hypothetical protein
MARPQSKKTAEAVAWVLSHPGCIIAGVAQAYGIHRVTLCVALKKARRPNPTQCPDCGVHHDYRI